MILAEDPITHNHPQTAEETIHPSLVTEVEESALHWAGRLREWWHWGALGLVTIHTVYGTWEVISFFLSEYPHLEAELANHAVTTEEVDFLIARALVRTALTIVNAVMTVRLHTIREKLASTLELLGATLLALCTPLLQHLLESLHIISSFSALFF